MDISDLLSLHMMEMEKKTLEKMFIGHDGREYTTSEALMRANEAHFNATHFYVVRDAQLGRREIHYGAGVVQICVGHKIEYGLGYKKYVPVFKT